LCEPPLPFWNVTCMNAKWRSFGDVTVDKPDLVDSNSPVLHDGSLEIRSFVVIITSLTTTGNFTLSDGASLQLQTNDITIQGCSDIDDVSIYLPISTSDMQANNEYTLWKQQCSTNVDQSATIYLADDTNHKN